MKLRSLIRLLQKLEVEVGRHAEVTIDLRKTANVTTHEAEGLSHWGISEITTDYIRMRGDDDSFYLKDGSERMRTVVVIS